MIRFQCPHCRSTLKADEELAGRAIRCSHCQQKTRVPADAPGPAGSAASAGRVICVCGGCKAMFAATSRNESHRVKCPKCGTRMDVPGADQVTATGQTIRFACEKCRQAYCVLAKYAGKRFPCVACKTVCHVPKPPEPESAPAFDLQPVPEPATATSALESPTHSAPAPDVAGLDDLAPDSPPPRWADELEADLQAAQQRKRAATTEDEPTEPIIPRTPAVDHAARAERSERRPNPVLAAIAVPLGFAAFYVLLVVGAFVVAATARTPPDKTSEAIQFNRGVIMAAARGRPLTTPETLGGFVELIEEGGIPKEEQAVDGALAGDVARLDCDVTYKNLGHGGSAWVVHNTIEYEVPADWPGPAPAPTEAFVLVTEFLDDFRFQEILVFEEGNLVAGIGGLEPTPDLQAMADAFVLEKQMPPNRVMIYLLIVAIVVAILLVASYWRVYEMGDEFGWACLVPIYNMVCLARIGDRPTVVGVLAGIAPFIPFLGGIVFLLLHLYIAIGVAQTFNRSALFGFGLALCPFIFYPTLAFTQPPS